GKLTFTPAPNASGTALVTVVLHDDGGTANGGVDTSQPQSFQINVVKLHPLHNAVTPMVVDDDGHVVAHDVLGIINFLNSRGQSSSAAGESSPSPFYDVNGDGFVSPIDALTIINHINFIGTRGESTAPIATAHGELADVITLLALDPGQQF